MTNDNQQSLQTENKPVPFGTRLKSARETLGLERKDVAAQLRLNEKVIIMMEKDRYAPDLPITFIRGYLRAYGKLLQIPEHEIKKAIEPIKPKATQPNMALTSLTSISTSQGNGFMRVFNYAIIATLISLVGIWWYTHLTTSPTENQTGLLTENAALPVVSQAEIPPPSATTTEHLAPTQEISASSGITTSQINEPQQPSTNVSKVVALKSKTTTPVEENIVDTDDEVDSDDAD